MSHLTEITTPFGLLSEKEQLCLKAWRHGHESYRGADGWYPVITPDWHENVVYRAMRDDTYWLLEALRTIASMADRQAEHLSEVDRLGPASPFVQFLSEIIDEAESAVNEWMDKNP